MDTTELESVTSSMSTKRSNQLSYASKKLHCTQESIDCKPGYAGKGDHGGYVNDTWFTKARSYSLSNCELRKFTRVRSNQPEGSTTGTEASDSTARYL
jgi:hypothetical protein